MATLAEVLRQAGYVTPQGQVTGPRTDLAQKLKSYVMNIPQNAAQNLANQRADIDAALTMGQGGIQIGDRAAFARQMAEVPNLMGLTAYHGTPHTIKGKFDISKVGTGEGAQAYGHGMYFAESPNVAKTYAEDNLKYPDTALGDAQLLLRQNLFNYDAAKKDAIKNLEDLEKFGKNKYGYEKSKAKWQETLDLLNKGNIPKIEGNLYKVDIPDEYIPNMLDWDKPLGQQNKELQKAIEETKKFVTKEDLDNLGGDINLLYNKDIDVVSFLNTWADLRGKPNAGEELLSKVGVKGIRYLDEGSRKSGKGTSNFVVFDPSEVKILEQNSKPMTRKEIIEQELEKVTK